MSRLPWIFLFGLVLLAASAAIVGYGGVIEQGAAVGRITLAAALVAAGILGIVVMITRGNGGRAV